MCRSKVLISRHLRSYRKSSQEALVYFQLNSNLESESDEDGGELLINIFPEDDGKDSPARLMTDLYGGKMLLLKMLDDLVNAETFMGQAVFSGDDIRRIEEILEKFREEQKELAAWRSYDRFYSTVTVGAV